MLLRERFFSQKLACPQGREASQSSTAVIATGYKFHASTPTCIIVSGLMKAEVECVPVQEANVVVQWAEPPELVERHGGIRIVRSTEQLPVS